MRRTGWLGFGLWAVPGAVLGLQVSAIGVLLLPLGLGATIVLARHIRVWPEALGTLEGISGVCLLIGALHLDYWSCPPSGEVITRTQSGFTAESCGAVSPLPWLIVALALSTAAAVAFAVARRRGVAAAGT